MSAAEYGLPSPDGAPSWLSLAQNVFSDMHERWDTTSCNGGLKWQIYTNAPGYDYKNSISNGLYFQLGARLAKLTGSPEYITEAEQVFEWVQSVGLIDSNYNVYDGTDDTKGCTSVDHDQWTYNAGVYLYGSAVMQALTNDPNWVTRTNGLLGATSTFFQGNVMAEKCEQAGTCNVDQLSFKAYLSRWLAATSVVLPSTAGTITPLLQASASGAVASCAGGPDSATCGTKWFTNNWDGSQGAGQQLAALEVVHGLLAGSVPAPQLVKRVVEQSFQA
jgi:mannan endo-1,6-alpha-mannosidase